MAIWRKRGRYDKAVPFFEKAIALDPDFALAYTKLAVASNNLGQSNKRDEYAKKALEHLDRLSPRERYYIQGFFYSTKFDTMPQAIDAYRTLLQLYPSHSATLNSRGHG